MLVGSDYDDIRQSLTHENLPSRGLGQALPTSAETPASQFHGGRLYPNMSHVATVIKTKQKVISVNVNTLLQFENNESNLFQFKLRTVECRFPSLSRRCWPW